MNARSSLLLIGILAIVAAACGGGGGGKTLTPDDFCTMKASAECSGSPTNCALSLMDCTAKRKSVCMAFVTASNVTPRVFVAGNVGGCISKTMTVYKKPLITADDLDQVADTCNYVFQGDVADLKACTTKYDCKNKSDICDKGFCAAKMTVGGGAQCSNLGAVCGSTQYCTTMGAAMLCVDKLALGKPCDATNPCDDTKMLTCTGGVCVKQSDNGGSCATDVDCLAAAPYCNPYAGGKCSPGLNFSAGSNSCNDYGGMGATTGFAGSNGGGGGAGGAGGATGAAGSDGGSAGAGGSDASGAGGATGSDAASTD
jgi:hypothetical protein